jgi:hypothetical protein
MSENNENKNKNLDVTVTVDRSFELESLRAEKDAKIEELESALSIVAEKELRAKAEKYGVAPTVEAVTAYQQAHSNTAPLNQYQINGGNVEEGYDSIEQGILSLNEQAESNPELKKTLGKVAKKALKPNNGTIFDYTYEGGVKAWRKPVLDVVAKGVLESEESLNKRKIAKKLEQRWKRTD